VTVPAPQPPESPPPAIRHLFDSGPVAGDRRGSPMPEALQARYGGPLEVRLRADRPTVLINFVSTIDGVVALGPGEERGGGVISGFFEPDRFVMAILRALSDVLLMGAGTIRGGSNHQWTADHLHPQSAADLARWRRDTGLAPQPTTVIVTGSGDVRLGRRGLDDPTVPVVFATTEGGARRLRDLDLPSHARIETVGAGPSLTGDDLATLLSRLDARVVLSEGGPHLYGDLVEADLADELFLTVAPQLIGRNDGRLGLIEGIALPAADASWQEVVSVKRSADHLFLRYRRRR
jgi:riboflavin biosynthesis pyrimidine reductase